MPREDKSAQINKAQILLKQGKKLVEISKELGVPEGTVRRWKHEGKLECERSVKKANVRKPKKAAPIKEEAFLEKEEEDITDKRELFCLYYVKYRNQVKAYQKAYKCSYENACSNASKLLKNTEVRSRINELLEELRENIEVDIKDIARKQADIAYADAKDFFDISKKGTVILKPYEELDGTLIKEIKNGKFGIEIKLKDGQKALDWLGGHQDVLAQNEKDKVAPRIELTGRKEMPDDYYMDSTV